MNLRMPVGEGSLRAVAMLSCALALMVVGFLVVT